MLKNFCHFYNFKSDYKMTLLSLSFLFLFSPISSASNKSATKGSVASVGYLVLSEKIQDKLNLKKHYKPKSLIY